MAIVQPFLIKIDRKRRFKPIDYQLIEAKLLAQFIQIILYRMIERRLEISHIVSVYNISSSVKNHRLYPDFEAVRDVLAKHQFVCWIAGGAVRDFCLKRDVNEFDLVTDASTEILKELFPKAVLVGETFGVLKLPLPDGEFLDLATFREESEYLDGRRPSQVFSSTPTKDSVRRDFTVNAMYWNDLAETIVDYQGGTEALQRRELACVGVAETRFNEDYLRILRLARFGIQLEFEFESETEASAFRKRAYVNNVSGERIWQELRKMEKAQNWNFGLRHKLFRALLTEIFSLKNAPPEVVPAGAGLFLFIYLLDPEMDFTAVLKSRLKVSNAELQTYTLLRFLLQNYKGMNVADLTFALEKSPALFAVFAQLIASGLIPAELDQSVQNCKTAHAESLISAGELVNLIPNHFISEELKNIRVGQLNNDYKTKAEVLLYLKKKYAN